LTSILVEGDKGFPKRCLINEYPTEVAKLQVKSLHRLRARQRAQGTGENLLDLIRSTLPSGVSNELDRVYSLLSLADEAYRKNVMVIYDVHKAVPYSAVVEHAIKRSGNLNILFDSWPLGLGHPAALSVEAGYRKSLEPPVVNGWELPEPLPTWMPDFSKVAQSNSTNISQKGFFGATFSPPKMKVNLDLELKLEAVALGTVEKLYQYGTSITTRRHCGMRTMIHLLTKYSFRDLEKRRTKGFSKGRNAWLHSENMFSDIPWILWLWFRDE
jgi:hypothetical protein